VTAPAYTLPAPPAGDPAALRGYAAELEGCADSFQDLGTATRSVTAGIRDRAQWTGDAADAYTSFCGLVAQPLGEAPARLRSIAAALRRHADVLDRAQQRVLAANVVAEQATPEGVPTAAAAAQESGGAAQREVDESGKAETGEVEESNAWYAGWWEKAEPLRKVIEGVLAPFDIVAADHWIELLEKAAGVPEEWISDVDKTLGLAKEAFGAGKPASNLIINAAHEIESAGNKIDAWEAFSPAWLRAAAGNLAAVRGLSTTLTGLGLVADAGTLISPADRGATGVVDRGAAGLNGTLLVLNLTMDEMPGIGQVVMVGTGVYLAGDYLYHHWTPFRNVCDDVGHGTVTAAKDVGHAASSGWHATTKFVGGLF
jgi:uncharacterized protein YukE